MVYDICRVVPLVVDHNVLDLVGVVRVHPDDNMLGEGLSALRLGGVGQPGTADVDAVDIELVCVGKRIVTCAKS